MLFAAVLFVFHHPGITALLWLGCSIPAAYLAGGLIRSGLR